MRLSVRRENSVFSGAGTDLANLYESEAPSPLTPHVNTWGGARNSASRRSDHIPALKAVELVEAAQRALAIGKPFNRHLTVHWEAGNLTDGEAATATGRLVKLIRDWVRCRGGEVVYAWVRENGARKGSHSHILLHIPDGLALRLTSRWYRTVTLWQGSPSGLVKTRCIGGTARAGFPGSDWYKANLANLVHYLLKGVNQRTGLALGLDAWESGGAIIGKRLSVSTILRRPR